MSSFDFLKLYIENKDTVNQFFRVPIDEISRVESQLGFTLPNQYKNFIQEIGYGFLRKGKREVENKNIDKHNNRILSPLEAKELYKGESNLLLPEPLLAGDFPFFEIDPGSFLVLKPLSQQVNLVYFDFGDSLNLEFDQLINKLYFENPYFYFDLID